MTQLLERFADADGPRKSVAALRKARLCAGDLALAEELYSVGTVVAVKRGDDLIVEGGSDNDLCILLSGEVEILVKGVTVNRRKAGDHIGEICAIDPSQTRSATVRAETDVVVLRVPEPAFAALADARPALWRTLAGELAIRLVERNALVRPANERPKVFVICSTEALAIAQHVQAGLMHDDMLVTLWTDGVFRASDYPLEALERAAADADFAVVVLHPDDEVHSRGESAMTPRDNVTFELGMFTGVLSRERTIVLEPAKGKATVPLKLCSDTRGLTTLPYRGGTEDVLPALLGPACLEIRKHIARVGVRR
jgi:CRP/FNR family cyclic AMP-dependent transcriptional regulator